MTDSFGIHHITAIAGDPARNLDFYTRILGLRLIKRTVNFDDPGTWHLYFGDRVGTPGTILTFFPYPGARAGLHGTGQAVEIALAVPQGALVFWADRLTRHDMAWHGPEERLGEMAMRCHDPDGLVLELVEVEGAPDNAVWVTDEIAADAAVRGFHGVTLWEQDRTATAALLTTELGFEEAGQDADRVRLTAPGHGLGRHVDLHAPSDARRGLSGAGTVHHIAFRAAGETQQRRVQDAARKRGLNVTPIVDRNYFRSIYFREPGGVLFEVATDAPGFAIDEPVEGLGRSLRLPPALEPRRAEIEAALPALDTVIGGR